MFCTQATGTITPSEFRQAVENRFRNNLDSSAREELFVRDKATNNYTFPHISFAEYFVADKVMKQLMKGEAQSFFECVSMEGAMEFLIDLATISLDRLSLLYPLLVAETAQEVDRAIRLLRGVKKDKLFQFLLDVLNDIHFQYMGCELPAPAEKIGLLFKVQERLEAGLSNHVIEALGQEEFLNKITTPIQQMPSLVRRFLFEVFQSSHIRTAHILEELKQAIYQDPDIHLRLLAVHVLIQRNEKRGIPVLVKTIGSRQAPVELRKACVKELQASTDDTVRSQVLTMLHKVIRDNRDDLSFRRECITLVAQYNTQEALQPLVNILGDFDHELFYFCADTLQTRTSVPSIADTIEEQIINPIEEDSAQANTAPWSTPSWFRRRRPIPPQCNTWRLFPGAPWASTSATPSVTRCAYTTIFPSTPRRIARFRCCCAVRRDAKRSLATCSIFTAACWSAPPNLTTNMGGGSLTALPFIETQAGDVSAYIPTNVISITDGQIFLESDLFNSNVRPAINVGISVSRVGGNAQTKAMKSIAGSLRLDLAQYRALAAFAQFGSDLDKASMDQLNRGKHLVEILKQGQYQPLPLEKQVMIIYAGTKGFLDDLPVEHCRKFEEELYRFIDNAHRGLWEEIRTKKALDKDLTAKVEAVIKEFKARFVAEKR